MAASPSNLNEDKSTPNSATHYVHLPKRELERKLKQLARGDDPLTGLCTPLEAVDGKSDITAEWTDQEQGIICPDSATSYPHELASVFLDVSE